MLVLVVCLQTAQAATLLVRPSATVSNVVQLLVPLVTAAICLHKALKASVDRRQEPWLLLTFAFSLWAMAQSSYLLGMLAHPGRIASWLSDALWLAFPFPLMLAASRLPRSSRRDAVRGLDIAQASLFFVTLYVLAFLPPAILRIELAYIVQSIALLLACALRYSISVSDRERVFYRRLTWFATSYALFSTVGCVAQLRGGRPGTLADLCWSAPFSLFSLMAIRPVPTEQGSPAQAGRIARLTNLHGVSAHCLTAMSLAAATVLALHHPMPGGITLLCAFLLSAARTSLRDWQMQVFHSQIERWALHDSLTGLPNRSYLQRELAARIASRQPGTAGTGVLFIDLDRFHLINDGLGYAFGDLLLDEVARLLKAQLRPCDVVGRSGGDEFLLVLDTVTAKQAQELAEQILAMLRQPIKVNRRMLSLTASAGLALAGDDPQAETLLQAANCAMYAAKRFGRDRVQTFAPEMLAVARGRHELYNQLRTAIDEQRIEVYYQPIYSLEMDAIVGFEALARWRDPDHGFISPAEFVPLAEETGLIVELGRQVLERACSQCARWNRRYGTALTISVNVSAHQFAQAGLLANVVAALEKAGLPPALLKLEVTESVLLSGYLNTGELLDELRATGVGLSLDDFGTGYSSLSYMLNLPFDVVKIDQSFVHSFDSDSRRGQIVRSIIDLAGKLQMKIVAEGVETLAEMTRLWEHGCDMVQGYFVSKPLPPRAVDDLLKAYGCKSIEDQAQSTTVGAFAARTSTVTAMGAILPVEARALHAATCVDQASLTAMQRRGGQW